MTVETKPANNNHVLKIVLAFAAIYIIWGTTYLAIRVAVDTIPPFLMAGTRFLIAGVATFAFLRARGVPMPVRLQWRSAAVVGAFMLVGGNGLVTWSEQQVPSGMAALVVATVPLWMAFFDWLSFDKIRPTARTAAGLILGFIGLGLLIGPRLALGTAEIGWFSWFILFLAPIMWSFGSLHSRRANLPKNVFMSTALEMATAGVLLLLAGLLTGEGAAFDVAQISARSLIALLYLTIFGSIVAFTAYIWLLKNVQATRATTYTYVNPVIAVLLGWLILDEPISRKMIVAAAIIFLAVIMITTQKSTKHVAEEEKYERPLPSSTISPKLVAATPKSDTLALPGANPGKEDAVRTP